jgi:hypothetical protein
VGPGRPVAKTCGGTAEGSCGVSEAAEGSCGVSDHGAGHSTDRRRPFCWRSA